MALPTDADAELQYADHLSQKIRRLLPGAPNAVSPDNVFLREQAQRTMLELQAQLDGTLALMCGSGEALGN